MSAIIDFLKALAGICETPQLSPELWAIEGNRVTVRLDRVPELQKPGAAVYLKGKGLERPLLVVAAEGGGYHCFSNRCTHAGRKLDPVQGKPTLRCCSVSHSTFDYEGNKLTGPAKGPVKVYEATVEDGVLVITV